MITSSNSENGLNFFSLMVILTFPPTLNLNKESDALNDSKPLSSDTFFTEINYVDAVPIIYFNG